MLYLLVTLASFMVGTLLTAALLRRERGGGAGVSLSNRGGSPACKPCSGGIAIAAGVAAAVAIAALAAPAAMGALWPLLLAAACLTAVARHEDRRGIAIPLRLLLYLLAGVPLLMAWGVPATLELPGVEWRWPAPVAAAFVVLFVGWLVNLYNFMDGIDGYAGGMAVAGFGGYAALGLSAGRLEMAAVALGAAAAAAGFLRYNFPPARIMMGDSGAVLLGYLAAGLALWGAREGVLTLWVAVLIFSPFIADATVTVARRALAGERVWESHETHYYQQLAYGGWGHRKTTLHGWALMAAATGSALLAGRLPVTGQWLLLGAWTGLYILLAWLISRRAERRAAGGAALQQRAGPSDRRARILIVSQYFWPESFPINDVARGLRDLGHDVAVLTGKPNYPSGRFWPGYGLLARPRETHQGIDVRRVPLVPRGRGNGWRLAVNYLSFMLSASLLAPWRCREQVDAVLVYAPSPITVAFPGLILGRWQRVPVLLWIQDLWPESLQATGAVRSLWLLSQVGRVVRAIYRRCDLLLVSSPSFVLAVESCGIERSRIRYLPNTAANTYRPLPATEAVPERSLLPDGFVVMFAGNVGAAQGFEFVVEAADRLSNRSDIHWVVLGDGRRLPWLRQQVAQRGLDATVHLLGRHPVESMPRFFAHADVLLACLRRDPILGATVPAKLVSYLACGRPVIAALEGDGAQVVEQAGAGIVVPPEDAAALADAVLRMAATEPRERDAMGLRARSYFEHRYERNRVLERLSRWIADLADGRQPVADP
jgi:UDP-N-acetylmuramyl pentapeptide phosphotransferase/UDP-N-acetylglucosamine-1-phosphate transferase/glycosyltransferase involved in cell wall biosynthesis